MNANIRKTISRLFEKHITKRIPNLELRLDLETNNLTKDTISLYGENYTMKGENYIVVDEEEIDAETFLNDSVLDHSVGRGREFKTEKEAKEFLKDPTVQMIFKALCESRLGKISIEVMEGYMAPLSGKTYPAVREYEKHFPVAKKINSEIERIREMTPQEFLEAEIDEALIDIITEGKDVAMSITELHRDNPGRMDLIAELDDAKDYELMKKARMDYIKFIIMETLNQNGLVFNLSTLRAAWPEIAREGHFHVLPLLGVNEKNYGAFRMVFKSAFYKETYTYTDVYFTLEQDVFYCTSINAARDPGEYFAFPREETETSVAGTWDFVMINAETHLVDENGEKIRFIPTGMKYQYPGFVPFYIQDVDDDAENKYRVEYGLYSMFAENLGHQKPKIGRIFQAINSLLKKNFEWSVRHSVDSVDGRDMVRKVTLHAINNYYEKPLTETNKMLQKSRELVIDELLKRREKYRNHFIDGRFPENKALKIEEGEN